MRDSRPRKNADKAAEPGLVKFTKFEYLRFRMSNPTPVEPGHAASVEQDAVESIVPLMPIVLPLAGGVLMLLLASIAIYMA